MTASASTAMLDIDSEYGSIHSALLETPRGRWFLAEHGRRARRIEATALEDAMATFKASLNEPPAVLGQLGRELQCLSAMVIEAKAALLDKHPATTGEAKPAARPEAAADILKTAEDIHEIAWSLQARDVDPQGCEAIARHAARLYALSRTQAQISERAIRASQSLDALGARLGAILDSLAHEMAGESPPAEAKTLAGVRSVAEITTRSSADLALVHATRRR